MQKRLLSLIPPNDVVMYNDIDELPNVTLLQALRVCDLVYRDKKTGRQLKFGTDRFGGFLSPCLFVLRMTHSVLASLFPASCTLAWIAVRPVLTGVSTPPGVGGWVGLRVGGWFGPGNGPFWGLPPPPPMRVGHLRVVG